jgi:hypothetical protein
VGGSISPTQSERRKIMGKVWKAVNDLNFKIIQSVDKEFPKGKFWDIFGAVCVFILSFLTYYFYAVLLMYTCLCWIGNVFWWFDYRHESRNKGDEEQELGYLL